MVIKVLEFSPFSDVLLGGSGVWWGGGAPVAFIAPLSKWHGIIRLNNSLSAIIGWSSAPNVGILI